MEHKLHLDKAVKKNNLATQTSLDVRKDFIFTSV